MENELYGLEFKNITVKLGEAKIINNKNISLSAICKALEKQGFSLIQNQEEEITEQVRLIIIETINCEDGVDSKKRFSSIIEKKIGRNYKYLSKLFSKNKKISIEQFIILAKIEKAKELIRYGELTFSEIAYNLGYTNPQHLSSQFKKIMGYTMTKFKEQRAKKRISMNKF